MATLSQLKTIQSFFSEERRFFLEGYYRLREKSDNEFEIEIAAAGPCGEYLPNPRIKFSVEDEKLVPSFLINQVATPVVMLSNQSASEIMLMEKNLDEIIEKFLQKID